MRNSIGEEQEMGIILPLQIVHLPCIEIIQKDFGTWPSQGSNRAISLSFTRHFISLGYSLSKMTDFVRPSLAGGHSDIFASKRVNGFSLRKMHCFKGL